MSISIEWIKSHGYQLQPDGSYCKAGGVLQPAKPERSPGDEPVAANSGTDHLPGFVTVRITSFRTRLIDERNLTDKFLVDALKYAGLIRDDSPTWCKIEVNQVQVGIKADERTEVIIT